MKRYMLKMMNEQGACAHTAHDTKTEVREEIRSWADPQHMIATVTDYKAGGIIYEGSPLSFR